MLSKEDLKEILKMLTLVSQIGLIMIISIGIGFFGGRFIDRALGFEFVFTGLFIVLGIGAGFWNIYRSIADILDWD
ncbi:AtpZ/AtpI family protein [Fuchsiella alkaliacetigena]|uniref:AtpZ/AtpI family protein n=1 Tax=Fuchsiella alkaliacetigena TaxID=957042 RepID=UPI002009EAAB|nr:AtpZ/AtpI family protein [Fuchsiella alkaliacetigena]MCK8824588.1 AtpZ/AtpI family protein [Fuchsiella alkaliacetigena]